MAFKDLNVEQRIIAVHVDMLKHHNFCLLGTVSQVGKVHVVQNGEMGIPTAGTDGVDVYYAREFCQDMTRKQLRYLVAHENAHKMFKHCSDYQGIKKKHPKEFAQAIDYVVNGQIEQLDTDSTFLERPTSVPPLVKPEYANMSLPAIVRDLLQNPPPPQPQPKGGKGQPGGAMDVHMDPKDGSGDGDATPEEAAEQQAAHAKMVEAVQEAMRQGEILQKSLQQMRGTGAGNASLSGFAERKTDWRGPLRRFISEICEGDEQSRFSPPNKRLLPQGIIMPSRFSESAPEIIVACDTSGSMTGVYPLVFGEIARIAQTVMPKRVRILWWDTLVAGEQVFEPKDYDKLKGVMKPQGGGGTTVSCVAAYIREKQYKPKVTIMLTDGYIESQYEVPAGNVLWGIVNNPGFVPLRGKALHISED